MSLADLTPRYAADLDAQDVLAPFRAEFVIEDPDLIWGKRVLVVEDGPTLTHGGMSFGAGTIAARRYGAAHIVDPRPYAVGSIKETYSQYPHLNSEVPAMGYSREQIRELEFTINNANCDLVIFATPIDLPKLLSINKPTLRVRYEYQDHGHPTLEETLIRRLEVLSK